MPECSTSLGALRRALAASGEPQAPRSSYSTWTNSRLPMFEPRKPLAEYGDSVRRLIEAIRGADALLVSAAAYHRDARRGHEERA